MSDKPAINAPYLNEVRERVRVGSFTVDMVQKIFAEACGLDNWVTRLKSELSHMSALIHGAPLEADGSTVVQPSPSTPASVSGSTGERSHTERLKSVIEYSKLQNRALLAAYSGAEELLKDYEEKIAATRKSFALLESEKAELQEQLETLQKRESARDGLVGKLRIAASKLKRFAAWELITEIQDIAEFMAGVPARKGSVPVDIEFEEVDG